MKAVQLFNFNTHQIRVVEINSNPWFVAKDVCESLGLTHSITRHIDNLDKSEVSKVTRSHIGEIRSGRPMALISESGLYKLVMRSDKPEAKGFQDWVTKVVLPAIRKDGGYIMGEEKVVTGEMTEDELVMKAMSIMQKKTERLTAERDGLASTVARHLHTITRFAQTIPSQNSNATKGVSRQSSSWRRIKYP